MKLIITGATGVAGLGIYRSALLDPQITAITLLLRREFPSWAVLPPNSAEKTTTVVHKDFTSYSADLAAALAQHDACVWAQGKSVRGISEPEYMLLTHDYPLAALRALRDAGVGKGRDPAKPFRFVYISGNSADPTEKSIQMWARVKGRAEKDILALCASEPGMRAHILRPGYFRPPREYPADWQHQRSTAESILDRLATPVFNLLVPSLVLPMNEFGTVALEVAKGRWPDVDRFENKAMREAAKEVES
ncbi:hypothetical protein PHLGIDRAFT_119816 [Phlebiopsis gigantea 11061_1 CR5-6]|uniref:NAD(P)-binding domain-containing protein n=1 Tax=Phlebiopsis gigantea (strain 11061_1 CR5-6) TaxID=745531 RepID=A0A0C3S575_PHLG1|nr:hypothetical protein PHLGIDRAFT_119816 [Phlebiopsis gigantea 11061_1 CR5-6]